MGLLNKIQNNLGVIGCYFVIAVMLVIVFYPTAWVVGASLNPANSLYSSSLIPKDAGLQNYKDLLFGDDYNYGIWYWNTIKLCTVAAVLSVVLTATTAYAFSKFRFAGRKPGLIFLLVIQMFPIILAMVALYVILNMFGLLDTHLGLWLLYLGTSVPFSTWMIKGYFDGIPRSLSEAARIDGANRFQVFIKIMLPLAKPILAVTVMFNFINTYKDYILASFVLKSPDKYTLAVGLRHMIQSQFTKSYPMFAAGAVLAAIPIVILFLYFQEFFISGLTAGATKG